MQVIITFTPASTARWLLQQGRITIGDQDVRLLPLSDAPATKRNSAPVVRTLQGVFNPRFSSEKQRLSPAHPSQSSSRAPNRYDSSSQVIAPRFLNKTPHQTEINPFDLSQTSNQVSDSRWNHSRAHNARLNPDSQTFIPSHHSASASHGVPKSTSPAIVPSHVSPTTSRRQSILSALNINSHSIPAREVAAADHDSSHSAHSENSSCRQSKKTSATSKTSEMSGIRKASKTSASTAGNVSQAAPEDSLKAIRDIWSRPEVWREVGKALPAGLR